VSDRPGYPTDVWSSPCALGGTRAAADPRCVSADRPTAMEELLERYRPQDARRLPPRERRVEGGLALIVAAVALALALAAGPGAVDAGRGAVLIVALALASRVDVYLGAGAATPTPVVFVPLLFALPPPMVPLAVAAGLVLGALPEVARGREGPERLLTAVADAFYAIPAALVFAALGEPAASWAAVPALAAALVAAAACDVGWALLREWLSRGVAPRDLLGVVVTVAVADLLLAPVGLLAAMAARSRSWGELLVLPLVAVLALLAHDRNSRLEQARLRLEALRQARERQRHAVRRVGSAAGAGLEVGPLLGVLAGAAADALGAGPGDAAARAGGHVCRPGGAGPLPTLLAEALDAAEELDRAVEITRGGRVAAARPLRRHAGGDRGALGAERAGGALEGAERELLDWLAAQADVGLENLALHERLRREATEDALTGLANNRAFRARLAEEETRARRFGHPFALLLLDLDNFKSVNDTHGHQTGDEVLRAAGAALRATVRAADLPARYGGEELVVLLPETDAEGAGATAEAIRAALHAIRVPAPAGGAIGVRASIGVAGFPADAADGEALVARADEAVYRAKAAGKDRVELAAGLSGPGGSAAAGGRRSARPAPAAR
jgi:diguanylate cyclase (GGDEF)-like protein